MLVYTHDDDNVFDDLDVRANAPRTKTVDLDCLHSTFHLGNIRKEKSHLYTFYNVVTMNRGEGIFFRPHS